MKKFGKCLLNFDIFERPYNFELNKQQHFKTITGTVFTLLIIVTTSILSFLFGQEIFLRRNPIVNTSEEHDDYSNLYFNKIPFFFSFHWHNGSFIQNINKILSVNVKLFEFKSYNNTVKEYPGLTECSPDLYKENGHLIEEAILSNQQFYCLSQSDELYFNNKYGAVNSAFIHIEFEQCKPTINNECYENIKELTNELYVRSIFINSFVNPTNYNNPVISNLDSFTAQIGNTLLKRSYFEYNINRIETDKGWVLEDKDIIEYFKLSSIRQDINPAYDNKLYWISIVSSDLRRKTVRTYMKIQDLLAKVGGFSNGLYKAILFLLTDYVKFKYYLMISLLKFKNPSITLETNTVGICPFIPENNEIDKLGRKNYQIDLTKKKDMIIGCSDIKVEKDSSYDDLNYIEYSIFRIFRKRNLRKISIYESLIKNGKSRLSLEKLWQSVGSLTAFTSQVCQT